MRPLILFFILIVTVVFASANPAINSNDNTVHAINRNQVEEGFLRKLNTKCSQRDNHSCIMLKLIIYMNRIFKKSSIDITENLKVTQTKEPYLPSSENNPEDDDLLARSMKTDDDAIGFIIAEKIWKFIRSRELRYHVVDNADFIVSSGPKGNLNLGLTISPIEAIAEGRGKMKQMGPLIAMLATKLGVIGALFIKGLILLTGKALIVSKIALILSVIIALKKLLSKKHVTYEVVAHPHHHETAHTPHTSHDSYSSGWGRALEGFLDGIVENVPVVGSNKMFDGHDLAFAGQKPIES